MRLFKCLLPVLVLLLVEGSSARPGSKAPLINAAANAGRQGKLYDMSMTHPSQRNAPGQSGAPLPISLCQLSATSGNITIGNSIYQCGTETQKYIRNSYAAPANKADPNAGKSGVGGFGGDAGSILTNGGSVDVNTKADVVATAGAANDNRPDGSNASVAQRQGSKPPLINDMSMTHPSQRNAPGQFGAPRSVSMCHNSKTSGSTSIVNSTYQCGSGNQVYNQPGTGNKMIIGNNNVIAESRGVSNGRSSGVGGSGKNTGNGGSNDGSVDVNAKPDAVATAGAANDNRTDGSDVSGAQRYSGSKAPLINAAANAGRQGKLYDMSMTHPSQRNAPGQFGAPLPISLCQVSVTSGNIVIGNSTYQCGSGSQVHSGNSYAAPANKTDPNAGKRGVGGFGGDAGSILTNGGSVDVNTKADVVGTAGAANDNRTDGSNVSVAQRQGSSGGLLSVTSNAHSNAFGGSTSSSSMSTANGSGNAMAQSSSSAISTDGRNSSAFSHASASVNTNV